MSCRPQCDVVGAGLGDGIVTRRSLGIIDIPPKGRPGTKDMTIALDRQRSTPMGRNELGASRHTPKATHVAPLSEELRDLVRQEISSYPKARLKALIKAVGWPSSSFFRRRSLERRGSGPAPRPLDPDLVTAVTGIAMLYPWWGYKRIALISRRAGLGVSNRFVYRVLKTAGLLVKRRPRAAELYQAARLFELLPQRPSELWQADVTYIHIPGHGWWYAVTVIDYFSRYLLALHLTPHHDAISLIHAMALAQAEAERLHGPLTKPPFLVTDNGSSFIARRFRAYIDGVASQVRTRYRTPQQLACSSASTRR
jgi:Integrase core domain